MSEDSAEQPAQRGGGDRDAVVRAAFRLLRARTALIKGVGEFESVESLCAAVEELNAEIRAEINDPMAALAAEPLAELDVETVVRRWRIQRGEQVDEPAVQVEEGVAVVPPQTRGHHDLVAPEGHIESTPVIDAGADVDADAENNEQEGAAFPGPRNAVAAPSVGATHDPTTPGEVASSETTPDENASNENAPQSLWKRLFRRS